MDNYYIRKINLAIDYIEKHYHKKIVVTKLAEVAGLSHFYFHRIFKAVTGETVNEYIKIFKMARIYKSLVKSDKKIIDIAMDLGYQNSANLSRDTKKYFNCSPSEIRSKKIKPITREYKCDLKLNIEFCGIKNIPDRNIVYERVVEGYNTSDIQVAFRKILDVLISEKCDLMEITSLGIGHDDPDYVDASKCRYDACIVTDNIKNIDLSMFNSRILKGGSYATFLFEGSAEEFALAWDYIFKNWVINSNYITDEKPHIEEYIHSDSYKTGIYKAKLMLPVRC